MYVNQISIVMTYFGFLLALSSSQAPGYVLYDIIILHVPFTLAKYLYLHKTSDHNPEVSSQLVFQPIAIQPSFSLAKRQKHLHSILVIKII